MFKFKADIPTGYKHTPLELIQVSPQKLRAKFPYDYDLKEEIKAWEGAGFDPETKEWTVNYSPRNLYCLRLLIEGKDQHYHNPLTVNHTFTRPLFQHQRECVNLISQYKRMILAGDPGVGKTLIAIEVMERNPAYYWVVVPNSARAIWEYEFKRWQSSLTELWGLDDNRPGTYRIVSMHRLEKMLTSTKQLPTGIVIDESHFFKTPEAKRTEILIEICKHIRDMDGIILPMSGTCAPKDPSDWWVPAELCQPGWLRESTKAKLKKRISITEDMGDYFKTIGWKKHEVEKLYRRLKGLVIIRRADDCLDLPPLIHIKQQLPLTTDVLQAAEIVKKSAPRAITALIRLRQLSDGFQPTVICEVCNGSGITEINGTNVGCPACDSQGGSEFTNITTPKDTALAEYLTEDRTRIVIYAGFHASIDKCEKLARESGWKIIKVDGRGTRIDPSLPQNAQQAFIEGSGIDPDEKIAYIGHPTAGGVSITLNKSNIIVFYSNDFNGASRMQAVKRIHRIGTTKATIIDLLWLPSDTMVLQNLEMKQELQNVTLGQITDFWRSYEPDIKRATNVDA